MARSILSLGILTPLALAIATRKDGLASESGPPPDLTATVIALITRVNSLDRLASVAPFFLLMVDHLLCPDIIDLVSVKLMSQASALQEKPFVALLHYPPVSFFSFPFFAFPGVSSSW